MPDDELGQIIRRGVPQVLRRPGTQRLDIVWIGPPAVEPGEYAERYANPFFSVRHTPPSGPSFHWQPAEKGFLRR
jgi:hypothetical protein